MTEAEREWCKEVQQRAHQLCFLFTIAKRNSQNELAKGAADRGVLLALELREAAAARIANPESTEEPQRCLEPTLPREKDQPI